jgi:hypothetical protein
VKLGFLPLILPIFSACTSTEALEGPVRLGQTAYVSGPRVRPDRILEDSRCPADAKCFWAARLTLRATVLGGSWSRQVDLTLGTPVDIADGKLTLVEVVPGRRTSRRDSKPLPYRFTFKFQGRI